MRFFSRLCAALAALALLAGCAGPSSAPGDGAAASAGSAAPLRICCFDAGKADAILLWTDSAAVLIDTGLSGFGKEITAYLQEQGIDTLDCLILTHFDKDHIGGAAKVLRTVTVKQVLQSDCPKDSSEYQNEQAALQAAGLTAQTVRAAQALTLGALCLTVDPPEQTSYAQDESNNSSLIVTAQYGAKRFVFAGDAEDARLEEYLSAAPGRCDFLKVPYHGHWQQSLPALFAALKPAFAVITSSDDQQEDSRTVAALKAQGAQVFLTRSGSVLAVCDGESLQVGYAGQ